MHYYTEDGQTFVSKLISLRYARQTKQRLFFYYHDDVYSKLNWSLEPPQSLQELYKNQAQRIRDNYDYVILAFSGGYDSSNILETFHYNNIKLDKIVTVGALKQDSEFGVDDNHNGELYHNVFPYTKELGLDSITQVLDYTDYFDTVDNFSLSMYNENWVEEVGAWFSPHHWFWRDIERYVVPKEWRDKKVALIFGKDKPSLYFDDTDRGFRFTDTGCLGYTDFGKQNNSSMTRINFYWDPDNTDILVKQLHVLKRLHDINSYIGFNSLMGVQKLNSIDINNIVYDLKRPILFKSLKSKDNILSIRDNYIKKKKNSDIFDFFLSGIKKIDREVGLDSMRTITTRFYKV